MTDGAARFAAVLGLLVLVVLGAVGYFLADTQREQRSDLRERYAERTRVASALLDSLFAVAAAGGSAVAGAAPIALAVPIAGTGRIRLPPARSE